MADGPGTLSPLPLVLAMGLRPVTALAFLSFISSTALFIYLTCRLVSWARHKHPQDTPNQFFLLFYNLLFADVIQSIAFFLNVHSLIRNAIEAGNSLCWAQGWFLSTGDLASSAFISTIALHTFWTVVMGRKVSYQTFYWAVGGVWGFVYAMAIIGVVLHPHDFFVRAGAWCWINDAYGKERLWLHYLWIFIFMSFTIVVYATIFVTIYRRSHSEPASPKIYGPAKANAMPLMIVYPAIYTICTSPLAAGRIASLVHKDVPLSYYCIAGAMIACNGWLDVLMYTFTRRAIIFGDVADDKIGLDTYIFTGYGMAGMGVVTTIEGGSGFEDSDSTHRPKSGTSVFSGCKSLFGRSAERLVPRENSTDSGRQISVTTDISVGYETAEEVHEMQDFKDDDQGLIDQNSWPLWLTGKH